MPITDQSRSPFGFALQYVYRALFGVLLCLILPLVAHAASSIQVYIGSVKTLDVGTITRVIVGNDDAVEATALDNGKLLLLGKSPGVSDVFVWTKGDRQHTYTVRVYPERQSDRVSLVRSILKPFPNVKIQQKLGNTLLTGTVDQQNYKRFQNLTKALGNVVSLVEPQLNVEMKKSVVFDVNIIEINRSYERNLGINWNNTAAGPAFGVVSNIIPNNRIGVYSDTGSGQFGSASGSSSGGNDLQGLLSSVGTNASKLSGYLGITSVFGSQIQLLQSEGIARVLASPSLSTVSGEKATFLAGGDLPISTVSQFGSPSVQFRSYGTRLIIQPFVDRHNNIRSKITAEMSSIDNSVVVNGVPGLRRRETTSTVTARPGQTIVISGLVNASDTNNLNEVPGLGQIPILGRLFRSKDFQQNRTELVITATPRIQQPNAPIRPDLEKAANDLRGVLTGGDSLDEKLMN